MVAAAEANQAVLRAPVFLALRPEAIGVVVIGIGEHRRQPVSDGGGHHGQPARRQHPAVVLEVAHDATHEHDERRMHPLGLLDAALERGQTPQRLECDLAVAELARELLHHARQPAFVLEQQDARPGAHHGARVLPGEDRRDQQADDLVVAQRASVGVARGHQDFEEIFSGATARAPLGDDAQDQRRHARPRPVAPAERRQRQVRVHHGDQIDAALEVVEQVGEITREARAELGAHQAAARDEHGQLVECGEQVHLPLVAPAGDIGLRLLLHDARVGAQPIVAQRGEEQPHLLVHDLWARVVHDATPEDGNGEPVHLSRAQAILGGAEERRLRARPDERGRARARQSEREDLAEARVAVQQQSHRIAAQCEGVTEQRQGARQHRGRPGRGRHRRAGASPRRTKSSYACRMAASTEVGR